MTRARCVSTPRATRENLLGAEPLGDGTSAPEGEDFTKIASTKRRSFYANALRTVRAHSIGRIANNIGYAA